MAKQTFTTGQVLTAAQMTSLQQTAMGGGSTTAKTTSYVLVAADAGTVVQMNAAGATTITVNTALFAAGDTVQIQNIGAGVCTVTAGTATVTTAGSLALSQWGGGQLYFTSTSASIFFDIVQSSGMTNPLTTTGDTIYSSSGSTPARLGIGSTGQVLTVASGLPSWATPASPTTIVKQITFGTLKATASTSSTSFTDTGLSATITPTSASSKIMVTANVSLAPMASGGIFLTLTDGSDTILLDPTSPGSRSKVFSRIEGDTAGQYTMLAQTLQFVDSPGSTAAKTYKIRWFVSANTGYINRMTTDSNSDAYAAGISTITLTEYAV